MGIRLECTSESNRDLTQEMVKFAQLKSDFFISIQVSGIIFKQSSTSCGIDHVVVHHTDGVVDSQLNGQGMFTKIFTTLYPYIPVIDEGKLEKSSQAKNFLSRVEMMQKWWLMYDKGWTLERFEPFIEKMTCLYITGIRTDLGNSRFCWITILKMNIMPKPLRLIISQ